MNDCINSFIDHIRCELNLSACTVSAYSVDLFQWADYMTGGKPEELDAASVTVNDLRMWVADMSSRGLSRLSIRRKVSALRSFYRYLCSRGEAASNPAAELRTARPPKELPSNIRTDEVNAVIDGAPAGINASFEEIRDRLIVTMLYTTGLRCSELIYLRETDVNLAQGELKVMGKRSKERIVPFGPELKEMIESYISQRPGGAGPAGELFTRGNGLPLYRKAVYLTVHRALAGAHAARRSPHSLRHSFATDMLNSGADLNAVSRLLGHASLASTQIYTHLTLSDLQHNYQLAHPRAQRKGGNYGNQDSSNPF